MVRWFVGSGMYIAGVAFLAVMLAMQPVWADEAWNQDHFQIIDTPWADNQQFGVYLGAKSSLNQDQTDQGSAAAYTNRNTASGGNVTISPTFKYQAQTLEQELGFNLPLSVYYSSNDSLKENTNYSVAAESSYQQKNISESMHLSAEPDIQWTRYLSTCFINFETTTSGDEYFDRSQNQRLEPLGGTWQTVNISTENQEHYSFQATQVFRVGWGRIFEGQYGYQAMQLYEELSEAGQLQKPIPTAGVQDLSEIIAHWRQAYISDSRIKTKLSLKSIIEYLRAQGYIQASDVDAFLTVSDIYQNLADNTRPFGFALNGRLGGRISVDNHEDSVFNPSGALQSYQKNETVPYQAFAGAEVRYEAPLSRQWQFGTQAVADYIFFWTTASDRENSPPQVTADWNTYLDYYLNTRWQVGIQADLNFGYDVELHSDQSALYEQGLPVYYQREQFKFDVSVHAQNQLSPDLYFTATAGSNYDIDQYQQFYIKGDFTSQNPGYTLDQWNEIYRSVMHDREVNWYFNLSLTYRLM